MVDADGNAPCSVSATDDIHETGGIGFRQGGSRGHTNLWDYVRITDRTR